MLRGYVAAAVMALLACPPASAGLNYFGITGHITGIEANPVTGSTATLYDPSRKTDFYVNGFYYGDPHSVSGHVSVPVFNDPGFNISNLSSQLSTEYFLQSFDPNLFGFAANTNSSETISASFDLQEGKPISVQLLATDAIARYLGKPAMAIRIDGDTVRVGYDPVIAPNFHDATVIAHLDLTNAFIAYVPEPATWALLILGFGLAGATARRRSDRYSMS